MKYNVIIYDFNSHKFVPYDIFPYLVKEYNKSDKRASTFEEYKSFILSKSRYMWWSRCEYEIILTDWPNKKIEEKWDIYNQIEMNIDAITNLFISSYGNK